MAVKRICEGGPSPEMGSFRERKAGDRYRSPLFRQPDVSFPRAREAERMLCFFHDFQIKVILWRSSVI
ncbi:MAG: hypothetical protein BAA03_03785 [Caldibacillus debilis]|nr:MAG: hypothetical protein BAA03_03785 [Caldibacillus debilis]